MYLKYSDLPIFSNLITFGENKFGAPTAAPDATLSSVAHLFAATEASLSLDANLAPNRYLGVAQRRNDFSITGPLQGKFSVTFCPLIEVEDTTAKQKLNIQKKNQLNFFKLTGNVWSTWNFSNYKLKKTFLQSYSIKINPYQPVMVTANFVSYDTTDITLQKISGYSQYQPNTNLSIAKIVNQSTNNTYYEALHGLTTNITRYSDPASPWISPYEHAILSNKLKPASTSFDIPAKDKKFNNTTYVDSEASPDIILPQSKLSIEVNVDCQRTPIYQLGDFVPSDVVLTSVERTITVQGEDIGRAIDINGGNPGLLSLNFLPLSSRQGGNLPSATNNVLQFDISGKIISQQLSVAQNAMLNGKVVIKEIIL